MWDAADVTDEDKKIAQFVGALRKIELTWYMNFTKTRKDQKMKLRQNS